MKMNIEKYNGILLLSSAGNES